MVAERKFSPALAQRLCDLVREGYTDATACATVGISPVCLYRWLRRGDAELEAQEDPAAEPETEYGHFARAYRATRAEAMRDAEVRVFRDKPEFWLKNGPGRYAWSEKVEIDMRAQVEHSGQIGVTVEAPKMELPEIARVIDMLFESNAFDEDLEKRGYIRVEKLKELGYIQVSKMVESGAIAANERGDAIVPAELPAPAEEEEDTSELDETYEPEEPAPLISPELRRSHHGPFQVRAQPPRFFARDRDARSEER